MLELEVVVLDHMVVFVNCVLYDVSISLHSNTSTVEVGFSVSSALGNAHLSAFPVMYL